LPEFPDKAKFIREINDLIGYFSEKRKHSNVSTTSSHKTLKTNFETASSFFSNSHKQSQSQQQQQQQQHLDPNKENAEKIAGCEQNLVPQADSSTYDILQNSQAFARITELARKAGAINGNDEYFVDTATGRLKTLSTNNQLNRFSSASSSSGVSSSSSTLNNEISTSSPVIESLEHFGKIENDAINEKSKSTSNNQNNETTKLLDEETLSMQFTRSIRELFLQRFVQMFVYYEKFVIVPTLTENNPIESWWMNREYSGNFDSKMFLIEQPSPRLPFLSHFIATQMFASFIDLKIVSLIDPNVKVSKLSLI
jgi:hypothetical protein